MRSLTISWTTVQTAILTNFALISDLRAGRAPVGFTRSNKLSHIYRTWNQGSFTDRPNVVGKQLSLQVQTYALKNVGMVSHSTRTLDRRSLGSQYEP